MREIGDSRSTSERLETAAPLQPADGREGLGVAVTSIEKLV